MKLFQIFLLICCLTVSFVLSAQKVDQIKKNSTIPDITIKKLNGDNVNILDYVKNGKITVLSFWATWCHPCKKELDAIAEIYDDWVKNYDAELIAITVDDMRSLRKVKPLVESKGWMYEILSDADQELQQALNFQAIPMTFLLDHKGNIVYTHNSYMPGDEFELEDKIKELAIKK